MAEWLVEQGIGEDRAILVEGGAIKAARLDWPGGLKAGQVEEARLVSRSSNSPRGTARFANGEEALVDHLPANTSEGSMIRLWVTRPALGEGRRIKLAQARPSGESCRVAPSLAESLQSGVSGVRIVRRFPVEGWDDLIAEAFSREVSFPGGSLILSPTPAMTLIDVDGTLAPRTLALRAVEPIAATLRQLDIGGSIGIDFPTLPGKTDRRVVDEALDAALAGWPHERTAMNGFGFVQLVARLEQVSLLHRAAQAPASMAARFLLRRAERLEGAGALLLTAHPAVREQVKPGWLDELARRTGREIRWACDERLAIEGGHAQVVAR